MHFDVKNQKISHTCSLRPQHYFFVVMNADGSDATNTVLEAGRVRDKMGSVLGVRVPAICQLQRMDIKVR